MLLIYILERFFWLPNGEFIAGMLDLKQEDELRGCRNSGVMMGWRGWVSGT